jgi:hypothetical protein
MKRQLMRRPFLCATIALSPCLALLGSCGTTIHGMPDVAPVDAAGPPRLDAPYTPEAGCFVKIESPELQPGIHVPIGTDITTWNSNPPSSGDHYPLWAAFQEYSSAVPRGYYVHDLEHGAIDFLYNCALIDDAGVGNFDAGDASTPCEALVQGLREAVAAIPTDPLCDPSIRVRFVLTPDPLIAYPVAAASWGWTYNASCVDLPTLEAFAKAHYGHGTEDFCANGVTGF